MVATRDLFIIFSVMLVLIIVVSAMGGSLDLPRGQPSLVSNIMRPSRETFDADPTPAKAAAVPPADATMPVKARGSPPVTKTTTTTTTTRATISPAPADATIEAFDQGSTTFASI